MTLLDITKELQDQFDYAELEHVPRMKNEVANNLAQTASGYKHTRIYGIHMSE